MTAFIASNATLIGDIIIGEESSVWFGCVLRAEKDSIRIGRGSNVQDLSIIHVDPGFPVTIGDEVIVGHRCIIHGCSIGNNTLIGMGAIVMNGARIGNFCIIGAGALIPKDMIVPDYTLVMGVPAKIIGRVTSEQMEKNIQNAKSYIVLAKEYRSGKWPLLLK